MTVTLEMHGDIAVLTIDNPPVNALGLSVRRALLEQADRLDHQAGLRAVVLCGAGRLFVGGADITEFDRPVESPSLPDVLARIDGAARPWVALLTGAALGGGLELALACRARIATGAAQMSLPETSLGLIPGAGGTQRLPRLIGVEAAVAVITGGKVLSGAEARDLGLVDCLAGEDPLGEALALAGEVAQSAPPPASARPVADPGADWWAATGAAVARKARGARAPGRALAAVRHGVEQGFAAGLRHERESFLDLRNADEARALRRLFLGERAAARPAALRDIAPLQIGRVGVVGAGTMGVGIAAALCEAGYAVTLSERDQTALDLGLDRLSGLFNDAAAKGRITAAVAQERRAGVRGVVGCAALADCDLVIEAVFEDIAVKRAVFAELGRVCRPDAILATNTSYLDPRLIAEGLPGPSRFLGIHFFSPAHVMKLVEVVPVPQTSDLTLATAFDLVRRLRKVPVRAGICEGFIGNRILRRYRAEAEAMLCAGVPYAAIDAALRDYGYPMGPFEMQDMAGLDIAYLHREAARARGEAIPPAPGDLLVQAGRKGVKTGGGWYDYVPGDNRPRPSAAAAAIIAPMITGSGREEGAAIAERIVAAMVEEGRRILEEGIADSALAVDLVEVLGYGFPRWRGGPMFAAGLRD